MKIVNSTFLVIIVKVSSFVPDTNPLDTRPLDTRRGILDKPIQKAAPAKQRLDKRPAHDIGPRGTRMRVVIRKQRIHLRLAHGLEDIRRVLAMVDEHGTAPNLLGRALRVRREAAGRIAEGAALPGVVGRRGADDDLGALGDHGLARVDEVGRVRQDGDLLAVDDDGALLVAGAGAVRAPVVLAAREGAAVVVPELDDDDVVGLDRLDDVVEAAFDGEGARAAAANGFVDDGKRDGEGEVDAPA